MVLKELLVLVQRIVVVDILDIRLQCGGCAVTVGATVCLRRVAFRTVVVLVAVDDANLIAVIIAAAVVVVVIACRVVGGRERIIQPLLPYIAGNLVLQCFAVIGIRVCSAVLERKLLLGAQSVQTYVLLVACTGLVAERHNCTGRAADATPDRLFCVVNIVRRQAVLKRLLAVLQYIFAYVTQVDVQVALVAFGVGEFGVEQPERYVLDICFLEVGVV